MTAVATGMIVSLWATSGQCQRSRRRASLPAAVAADPNAPASPNSWESFDVILKRNIFSRSRMPYRERPAVQETPRVMRNPEAYYMLKGVVQEDDQFIAFIEDTQSGSVLRLKQGDSVARGTIKTVTLDGIEYQMEDKTTVVRLGLDLEGGYGTMTTGQMVDLVTSAPSPSSSASPSAPASGGDTSDILKRLMEQRKQQLGQ
jgi:hypothetical protein